MPVQHSEAFVSRLILMQAVPHENAGQRAEWDRLQEHETPIHDISPKRGHRCGQRGVNVAVNAQTARLYSRMFGVRTRKAVAISRGIIGPPASPWSSRRL